MASLLKVTQEKKLFSCSYNQHQNKVISLFEKIKKTDKLSTSYDNITLTGDFNLNLEETKVSKKSC